jgi:hypothetical protein
VLVAMLGQVPLDLLGPLADALRARAARRRRSRASSRTRRGLEVAPRSAEAWRRLALAAGRAGDADAKREFAPRYARDCVFIHAPTMPVLWPRRTAGDALRVAVLVGTSIDARTRDAAARARRAGHRDHGGRARLAGRGRRARPVAARSRRRRSSPSARGRIRHRRG